MKKTLYFFFLWLLAAGWSYGQSNEVTFSAGAAYTSNQTLTLIFQTPVPCSLPNCSAVATTFKAGTALTFEASYARRFVKAGPLSLYLELPVLGTPGHGVNVLFGLPNTINGSTSSSLFFLTPSARVKFFPSARISPWVTFGGGWARLRQGGENTNTGALQFGGGVDVRTGVPHLGLRAEVRDFWSAGALQPPNIISLPFTSVVSPHHQHHLFAGGGVVLRF